MATYVLPDTVHGGSIAVSGNSLADAQQNAASQTGASLTQQVGGGTFGSQTNADIGGGGSSGGGGGGGGQPQSGGLDASFQKMLQSLASGNAQAFQEAKDEFNKNFALAQAGVTGTYNGSPTQAAQAQQAQLTGQYNGAPTEATREFNTNQAEQQRQFNAGLGQSLLNSATQLRGPQDYMQYQQLTHGGANLLSQLTQPGVQQTTPNSGQTTPIGIMDVLNALGMGNGQQGQQQAGQQAMGGQQSAPPNSDYYYVGTDGKIYAQNAGGGQNMSPDAWTQLMAPSGAVPGTTAASIAALQNGQGMAPRPQQQQQQAAPSGMGDVQSQVLQRFGLMPGQTFSPNDVNPGSWDSIGGIGQSLTKNVAESMGYDPTDFENRINATRPQGTAARLTNTTYRAPTGIF